MKDIRKDDINHCLRFQLGGQPLPAPPPPLPLSIELQDDKLQAEVFQQRLPSQYHYLLKYMMTMCRRRWMILAMYDVWMMTCTMWSGLI